MPTHPAWEQRVHQTVLIGLWIALVVAATADLATRGLSGQSIVALITSTFFVVAFTLSPMKWFRAALGTEALTLTGALLMGVALTFSSGAASPYLLVSVGPPVFATLYGGLRTGITTGFVSAGLLGLVAIARSDPFIEAVPAMALYVVFVLLVAVIRRLFTDIYAEASELAELGEMTRRELEVLEETHQRLVRLSEDISSGHLNGMEVAATTLETLILRFPGSSGRLVTQGDNGQVVLASRGITTGEGYTRTFPLSTAEVEVGVLELTTPGILGVGDEKEVETIVKPVSIAFANLQLLEDIVGTAVAEERIRLAREMHDDIGPSLASLGLSLDMASMNPGLDPDISADLKILRSNVTKLVEDVRETVADLRSAPGPTLTARVLQAATTLKGDPEIVVDLDERRPPRPALIGDLTAIITEGIRNAHQHAKATKVVVSGRVDRASGFVGIGDDGAGFDPEHEPKGHFGLIGMRERAENIDADIEFISETGVGTTISIEWGKS